MKVASFIQPMACLSVLKLPDGPLWVYEVKLDGYRAMGVNPTRGALPKSTVVDGEVVALDAGRPDFYVLTHSRKSALRIRFYVFDLPCFKKQDVTGQPLLERGDLLKSIPMNPPIKLLEYLQTPAGEMLDVVRQHGLSQRND